MSDLLDDEIERTVDASSIPEFHASAHTYIYTLSGGGGRPIPVWTGGMLSPALPTGSEMFTSPFLGQLPTIIVSRSALENHAEPFEFYDHVMCTPYHRVLRKT